jgi:hypothetical protein
MPGAKFNITVTATKIAPFGRHQLDKERDAVVEQAGGENFRSGSYLTGYSH